MRSMAEIVVLDPATDEALPVHDARLAPRVSEIGVRIDSAVNDRNANATAVKSGVPRHRRIDGVGNVVQRRMQWPIKRNIVHARLIGQGDYIPRLHGSRDGVD